MTTLVNITVTTAITAQAQTVEQIREDALSATIQCNFTYGSSGTTADVWVQTSMDGGGTWTDVCNFHMTTASKRFIYNLSALTVVTTEYDATSTDGALASNTAKDGVFGSLYRAKVTTTGTYAGGTTLRVDMIPRGRLTAV